MSEDRLPERRSAETAPARRPSPEAAPQQTPAARPFGGLLVAAAGVTGVLALALFVALAAFGFGGAPYAAVGAAMVGGVVMRRALLREPSASQIVLFTACTLASALIGLWLGQFFLLG